jgi:hypothetical protein
LAERKNVIFLGAPGTGKTDLSIASAVQAARRGRRVASASAHQWVTEPAAAKRQAGPDEEFERIGRLPLIVVDEVGYVPCDPEAAALFFTLVSSRCHLLIWREKTHDAVPASVARSHQRRGAEVARADLDLPPRRPEVCGGHGSDDGGTDESQAIARPTGSLHGPLAGLARAQRAAENGGLMDVLCIQRHRKAASGR